MHDLRYAARVLKNSPGFSVAAVLTLALGIGVNATIFSLFDAVALQPVRLGGSTPVLSVYQQLSGSNRRSVIGGPSLFSYADYLAYRDQNRVFSGIAAYMPEYSAMLGSDPQPVRGQLTSCNYFTVLGAPLAMGRGFSGAECAGNDAGPVTVISDEMWRTRFAADPSIIGKEIRLNRVPLTVIGVARAGFHGTELIVPSFWAPVTMQWSLSGRGADPAYIAQQNLSWLAMVGRPADRVSVSQVRADLAVIAARIDIAHPGQTTTLSVAEPSLLGQPDKQRAVMAVGAVFMAAVGLVLLIACANVANLFLARAASRQREIAVRLALGASRLQLVRQLLAESLVIALLAGALGMTVAVWSAIGIARLAMRDPTSTPISLSVGPDLHIVLYGLALVVITTIGFGLMPALHATRPDVNRALKEDDYDPSSRRGWLRGTLVGAQVAVCMVLLIAAGLLLRGLNHAETVDPGFSMDGTTVLSVDLRVEGYTVSRAAAFHAALTSRLKTLPGVNFVAEGTASPLGNRHYTAPFNRPGEAVRSMVEFTQVTPGYLSSVNIPILRGRDFTSAEAAAGSMVVIVNEAAARHFWPGSDPLGKTLHGGPQNHDYIVVAIARDAQVADLGKTHTPYLFIAAGPADALAMNTIIVRGTATDGAVAGAMRTAALALDPELHFKVAPLRDNLRPYIEGSRVFAILSSVLGGLALLLAAIGIYGTVAFTVARRTREIGIRVALGARSAAVSTMVVRQSMKPVVVGAAIGTGLCAAVSRVLAPVLFGVSAIDAVAFAGVPVFLLAVAVAASYLPAHVASRLDPMTALRQQ